MNRRFFIKSSGIALASFGVSLSAPSFLQRAVLAQARDRVVITDQHESHWKNELHGPGREIPAEDTVIRQKGISYESIGIPGQNGADDCREGADQHACPTINSLRQIPRQRVDTDVS